MTSSAFTWHVNEQHIGYIFIDTPEQSQNTLKADFAEDFTHILAQIEKDKTVKALIIMSQKENSFIAGADIGMLEATQTPQEAETLARLGQQVFDRLEQLPIPVIAAIHGACLGGGLELALACHKRICTDDAATRIGLPEVLLGLIPGSGGTQRLPRLIGMPSALDLMLTGKKLDARRAKKMGLVDEVVPLANLKKAAEKNVLSLIKKGQWQKSSDTSEFQWSSVLNMNGLSRHLLESHSTGRKFILDKARKTLQKKTRGLYPAPERIIESIDLGLEHGFQHGLDVEARFFGDLTQTTQAQALMHLYHATNELKKAYITENSTDKPADIFQSEGIFKSEYTSKLEDASKPENTVNQPIEEVGILGGGLMGAGITYVTLDKANTSVRLRDISDKGILHAFQYVDGLLKKKVKRKQYTAHQAKKHQMMLTATKDFLGFQKLDIVIEAVFEDLSLKQNMLQEVETHCKPETIFATNTSSILVSDIAKGSQRPENVIGLHYFSPVEKMPLLEVVTTEKTDKKVIESCVNFGQKQGKTVIVVKEGPGFYVNRILTPYLIEAAHLVVQGVPIDRIDNALVDLGFPMGPFALLDQVGLDVGFKVVDILQEAFGDRMALPSNFEHLKKHNRLGKKNGCGFYRYDNKHTEPEVDEMVYSQLGVTANNYQDISKIQQRCLLVMLNEAVRCLDEGIISSPSEGDIGAVFGIGFPAWMGGPFHYLKEKSLETIVKQLQQFSDDYGQRFQPCERLIQGL